MGIPARRDDALSEEMTLEGMEQVLREAEAARNAARLRMALTNMERRARLGTRREQEQMLREARGLRNAATRRMELINAERRTQLGTHRELFSADMEREAQRMAVASSMLRALEEQGVQ